MNPRCSKVDRVDLLSLAYSSVLEIGDTHLVTPCSVALAVQREHDIFLGNEGHFHYPVFTTPIPRPVISEKIVINRINESPNIHVQKVSVIGASFSSIIQIGSINTIHGEARVKHIRQLEDDHDETETNDEK